MIINEDIRDYSLIQRGICVINSPISNANV
jgi:hypothetical protein